MQQGGLRGSRAHVLWDLRQRRPQVLAPHPRLIYICPSYLLGNSGSGPCLPHGHVPSQLRLPPQPSLQLLPFPSFTCSSSPGPFPVHTIIPLPRERQEGQAGRKDRKPLLKVFFLQTLFSPPPHPWPGFWREVTLTRVSIAHLG